MDSSGHILFIEDDLEIGALVQEELRDHGWTVDWRQTGTEGWGRFRDDDPDLVLLDLRLPSTDGMDLLRRIREADSHVPVVILSAKAEKRDVVRGLEVGADDYVTKPFSTDELLARIEAVFRRIEAERDRAERGSGPEEICLGPLRVRPAEHRAFVDGEPADLTAKEFDLLQEFVRHPGRAFSRGELLRRVWGEEFDGFDHTVNTHINRLRDKIEPDPDDPTLIQTVWGVGYRCAAPEEVNAS